MLVSNCQIPNRGKEPAVEKKYETQQIQSEVSLFKGVLGDALLSHPLSTRTPGQFLHEIPAFFIEEIYGREGISHQ